MTRDLGSIDAGLVGVPFGLRGGPPQEEEKQVNIIALAHRLLRGRYRLAIGGGLAGAFLGGMLGYLSQKPLYQSDGNVRIQQTVQPVLTGGSDSDTIYNIAGYVHAHATYLKDSRVLERAMKSQPWRDLGRPSGSGALRQFRESVTAATAPPNDEMIMVSFRDKDPNASKVGLEEVLTAYEDLYAGGETRRKREQSLALLQDELRSQETKIQKVRERLQEESKETGQDDLGKILDKRNENQLALESEVLKLQNQLAERGALPLGPQEAGAIVIAGGRPLSPEEIALVDVEMARLLDELLNLENLLQSQRVRFTERHRAVKDTENAIEKKKEQIEARAEKWNKSDKKIFAKPNSSGQIVESIPQLQTRLAIAKKTAEQHRQEIPPLAQKRFVLDGLRRELDAATLDANTIKTKIDRLSGEAKTQAAIGGRIEVTRPTTVPGSPTTDRRKKYALLGMVLGGGFPVMCVALVGLLDGRMRFTYADQAREPGTNLPLLGILPQLPKDLTDPEQAAAVAHCVHQMRTLLQIGGEQRKVYAVTSSTAGDGKTSLTLSLGLSFAASGSRTLLVDFDLVGHGLSTSLKVRPVHGIAEALRTGNTGPVVTPTGIDRLWLLPAARDDDRFVSRLSERMVKAFIDSLRADYDVILIDTGPILGSLEANFVSSSADAVVLVVGRGQQRVHVQHAIEQLNTLRARVLGMVFNRADSADFMKSATSASFRSVRDEPASSPPPSDQFPELEPVARTVAMDVRR